MVCGTIATLQRRVCKKTDSFSKDMVILLLVEYF